MRQQKQPQYVLIGNFVIERFAMKINKISEELDVVAATRRNAVELGECTYSVGVRCHLNVGVREDLLNKVLRGVRVHVRVGTDGGRRRHMKTNFHQGDGRVLVLVKLQDGLVLAHVRVGHVLERYLKHLFALGLEHHRVAVEARLAPIPALDGQVAFLQ